MRTMAPTATFCSSIIANGSSGRPRATIRERMTYA